jgi:glyoxylase-like metal-dependent hydrolase (beta-lactamase superfamily II)
MDLLAPGVWLLDTRPKYGTNVYLIDDVLIDTGWRWYGQGIFRQLEPGMLSMVALTHAHPDHQGLAHLICETFDVPLACHELDVAAMEGRAPMLPDHSPVRLVGAVMAGSPHPVQRVLHEGDAVAGFRALPYPALPCCKRR